MAEQFKSRPRRLKAGESALAQLLGLSGTNLPLDAQKRNQGIPQMPPMAQPESAPVRSFLPQDQQAALQSYADRTFTQSNISQVTQPLQQPTQVSPPTERVATPLDPGLELDKVYIPTEITANKYVNIANVADPIQIEGEMYYVFSPEQLKNSAISAYKDGDEKAYNQLMKKSIQAPGLAISPGPLNQVKAQIKKETKAYSDESSFVVKGINSQIIDEINGMSQSVLEEKLEAARERFDPRLRENTLKEQIEATGDLSVVRQELAGIYIAELFDMPEHGDLAYLENERLESSDLDTALKGFVEIDQYGEVKRLSGPAKDPRVLNNKIGYKNNDLDVTVEPNTALETANKKITSGLNLKHSLKSENKDSNGNQLNDDGIYGGVYYGKANADVKLSIEKKKEELKNEYAKVQGDFKRIKSLKDATKKDPLYQEAVKEHGELSLDQEKLDDFPDEINFAQQKQFIAAQKQVVSSQQEKINVYQKETQDILDIKTKEQRLKGQPFAGMGEPVVESELKRFDLPRDQIVKSGQTSELAMGRKKGTPTTYSKPAPTDFVLPTMSPRREDFSEGTEGDVEFSEAQQQFLKKPGAFAGLEGPVFEKTEQAAPPIDPAKFNFDINTKEGRTKLQQMLVSQGINLKGTTKEAGVIQEDPTKALMPTKGVGRAGPRTKAGTRAIQQQLGVSPTGEWNQESAVALARKLSAEQDPISGVSDVPSLPKGLSFAQAPKSIKQPEFAPTDPKSEGTAKGEGGFFDKPGAKELAITGGLMGAEAFRYLMGTLGPAATYARKRIDQLEAEETDDFRDRALERQERKEGMAAIRGLGESTLREQEKAQAMQPRTSAARLQRMREGAQRELYRASLGLEKDVQARKGARAMQKQRELESLYQYEQQRRDAGLGRLTAGASQLAGQYGKITAAGAQLREYDPIKWAEKFESAGWTKEDAQKQAMEMVKIGANKQSYEQAMQLIKEGASAKDPRWSDLGGLTEKQKKTNTLFGLGS